MFQSETTGVTAQGESDDTRDAIGSREIIAGLLENRSGAAKLIMNWIRPIAENRAWGFDSAEDIIQETLLVIIRNFRTGGYQQGNLRHYVRRITKNICISSYRKAKVRSGQVPLDETQPLPSSGDTGKQLENRAMMSRILESLSDECRRLIFAAYFEGRSRSEIAHTLGISEGAMKVRLSRCLARARSG